MTTTFASGLCTTCGLRPAIAEVDGQDRRLCLACIRAALTIAERWEASVTVDELLHRLWHRRPTAGCRFCMP